MVTYANVSPKMVNPSDIAGECGRQRRRYSVVDRLLTDSSCGD